MTDRQSIQVILRFGRERWERLTDAVIRAADTGITASEAEQALRSLTVRCSGLSTVEIIPDAAIAALNANAKAHAQPTACHRCLYHSSSPLLACAVHPLGRPGEVCGDWEDGPQWAAQNKWGKTIYNWALVAAPALNCPVDIACEALAFANRHYRQHCEVLLDRIRSGDLILDGEDFMGYQLIEAEQPRLTPDQIRQRLEGEPIGH